MPRARAAAVVALLLDDAALVPERDGADRARPQRRDADSLRARFPCRLRRLPRRPGGCTPPSPPQGGPPHRRVAHPSAARPPSAPRTCHAAKAVRASRTALDPSMRLPLSRIVSLLPPLPPTCAALPPSPRPPDGDRLVPAAAAGAPLAAQPDAAGAAQLRLLLRRRRHHRRLWRAGAYTPSPPWTRHVRALLLPSSTCLHPSSTSVDFWRAEHGRRRALLHRRARRVGGGRARGPADPQGGSPPPLALCPPPPSRLTFLPPYTPASAAAEPLPPALSLSLSLASSSGGLLRAHADLPRARARRPLPPQRAVHADARGAALGRPPDGLRQLPAARAPGASTPPTPHTRSL